MKKNITWHQWHNQWIPKVQHIHHFNRSGSCAGYLWSMIFGPCGYSTSLTQITPPPTTRPVTLPLWLPVHYLPPWRSIKYQSSNCAHLQTMPASKKIKKRCFGIQTQVPAITITVSGLIAPRKWREKFAQCDVAFFFFFFISVLKMTHCNDFKGTANRVPGWLDSAPLLASLFHFLTRPQLGGLARGVARAAGV